MTLVRFGAAGDPAPSKLRPALHDLAASGRLDTRERWERVLESTEVVDEQADDIPGRDRRRWRPLGP